MSRKENQHSEQQPARDEDETRSETLSNSTGLILPHQVLPDKLYIIPVTNRPFFPAQVQPLMFAKNEWEETLRRVRQSEHKTVGLAFIDTDHPDSEVDADSFPNIGCAVKVHNVVEVENQIQFIAQGVKRFRITKWLRARAPFLVQVEYPDEQSRDDETLKAYAMALINAIKELLPLNPLYSEELKNYLNRFNPREPSPLADFAASITTARGTELQEILSTVPLHRRMEKVLVLIRKEQQVAKLQSQISEEVNLKIKQHQRKFFLQEQLKIIQKELGIAKDDKTAEIELFEQRLKERVVPEAAKKKIDACLLYTSDAADE